MATFLIGGIWHGAGWTFIFWGFLHGAAIVTHRLWKSLGLKMWKWLAWFITFNFVNIAWVFFRANSWDDAIKVLKGMIGLNGIVLDAKLEQNLFFLHNFGVQFGIVTSNIGGEKKLLTWIIVCMFIILFFKNSMEKIKDFRMNFSYIIKTSLLLTLSFYSLNKASEFLYFNF